MKIVNRTHGRLTLRFDSTVDPNGALIIEEVDIALGTGAQGTFNGASLPGAFANQNAAGVPTAGIVIHQHGDTGSVDADGAAADNVLYLYANNAGNAQTLADSLYTALQQINANAVAGPSPT